MMTLKNRISKLEKKVAKNENVEINVFLHNGDKLTNSKTGEILTIKQWEDYKKDHPEIIEVNRQTIESRE